MIAREVLSKDKKLYITVQWRVVILLEGRMPKIMGLQRGVTSVAPNTPSILVEMLNEFGML
jgi:hypothetical protein